LIEIALTHGLIIVEAVGPDALEVTFGDLRCAIAKGVAAIGYNEVDGQRGAAYVANRSASGGCLGAFGNISIERGTVRYLRNGQPVRTDPLSEIFWGNIREQR